MSFFAIVVSLMTLKEMQAQRELSITPMVFIQNFDTRIIEADSICEKNLYSKNILFRNKKDGPVESLDDWWNLELVNVGQGSAVNVKVDWDLDYEWLANFSDTLNVPSKIWSMEVGQGDYIYNYNNCGGSIATANKIKSENYFSHLLPASSDSDGIKVSIPQNILRFLIASKRALWRKWGQNEKTVDTIIFNNKLNLTYEGVNGKKITQEYLIKMELGSPLIRYKQNQFDAEASWKEFHLIVDIEKLK